MLQSYYYRTLLLLSLLLLAMANATNRLEAQADNHYRSSQTSSIFSPQSAQLKNGEITTLAGRALGDNGPAKNASLTPTDIIFDREGNLLVADSEHNRVRRIDLKTGIITTIAGNGCTADCKLGDGGLAVDASLKEGFNYSNSLSIAVDDENNLYIACTSDNRVRRVDAASGIITTIAGNGFEGFAGDGDIATSAEFNVPAGLAFDRRGDLYIADSGNGRIRKIDKKTGIISTIAGVGNLFDDFGDGGPAIKAILYYPVDLAFDSAGNLIVSELGHHRIRKIDSAGIISTIAGNNDDCEPSFGSLYRACPLGDSLPARQAHLFFPSGLTIDREDNIYIADTYNFRIRKVEAGSNIINTVAGDGFVGLYQQETSTFPIGRFNGDNLTALDTSLNKPGAVAVDADGNLFIADYANLRIRIVNNRNTIETIAGDGGYFYFGNGDNLPATNIFIGPVGIEITEQGDILFAETDRHLIRKVTTVDNRITTIAGTGNANSNNTGFFDGDGGPAIKASFNYPTFLLLDPVGNLLIADSRNSRIREISAKTGIIDTIAGRNKTRFNGDGKRAFKTTLDDPLAMQFDEAGNLFIVDAFHYRIRRIDAVTKIVTTVAGNGCDPLSNNCPKNDGEPAIMASIQPVDLSIDRAGNLFIVEEYGRVRRVDALTGIIETIAGNPCQGNDIGDNGPAISACLSANGIAVDGAGNIFIADNLNNRIRRIDAITGIITTVAGNGIRGYNGDGSDARKASLYAGKLKFDRKGNLFLSSGGLIRLIKGVGESR